MTIADKRTRIETLRSVSKATDANVMSKRRLCNKSRWQHLICVSGD
eukprot:IDg4203t1